MTAAPNLNARLGAVIRQRRVLLGLTQLALAARMGLTFQQIQKYEKGTNQVGFPRLVELAKALDTSGGACSCWCATWRGANDQAQSHR